MGANYQVTTERTVNKGTDQMQYSRLGASRCSISIFFKAAEQKTKRSNATWIRVVLIPPFVSLSKLQRDRTNRRTNEQFKQYPTHVWVVLILYFRQSSRGIERTVNQSQYLRLWFSFLYLYLCQSSRRIEWTINHISAYFRMVLFPVSVFSSKQQTDRTNSQPVSVLASRCFSLLYLYLRQSSRVIERTAKGKNGPSVLVLASG